jgi:tetratricopeptide (TPR) repeat protein
VRRLYRWFNAPLLAAAISSTAPTMLDGSERQLAAPQPPSMPGARDTTDERRTLEDWARGAQLFADMGGFHREVSTSSAEARRYFDQGMRFLWAFNHDEATRSFAKAAQLDPHCASCYWGIALTLGPNYNMPMMAQARAALAWNALTMAQRHAPRGTPVEQALIAALTHRYTGPQPLDPSNVAPLMASYASQMREVARRFPADLDVQTLFAESLMNISPWKLWSADGSPSAVTDEIVTTLEAVMDKDQTHPGANHYYIHAVEASPHPERALPSAERIGTMMPAAGHLDHMPAHIMQRVGRYEDAAEANRKGAAADAAYYSRTSAIDYYPVVYSAHNYQFLAFSAAMEGRSAETIEAMRAARTMISDRMLLHMPGADWSMAYLYEGMVRFGMWDAILREPPPHAQFKGLFIGYLGARATALAANGRLSEAKSAVVALDSAIASTPADAVAGMNAAPPIFRIASLRARARVAIAERNRSAAIALLRQAVSEEDGLTYNEPADQFFPTRHLLGAALLSAGMANDAETVYREDLRRNPRNGWALRGLANALEAQGKTQAGKAMLQQFERAWKYSDTAIHGSAF